MRLDSGADTNRNKLLDAAEIGGTQYVCNGSNGAKALVKMSAEPQGTHCTIGGTQIQAGLDANSNGTLDNTEATATAYVCNGSAGASGANTLIDIATEAAGGNCTNGGKKVTTGLDTNGNGLLDTSEVGTPVYVCNGSNGAAGSNGYTSLIRFTPESPGSNCANGGTEITSGLDSDRSGTLDTAEVTSTAYTCNGATGNSGSNGHSTLISTDNEPSGSNCSYGGKKITSWLDSNDNGTLDSGETPAISYVCNGAFLSWVTVNTPTVQAQPNTGYRANHASAQVVITLPANPAENDIIRVVGTGAGGWKIAQNAGQQILLRNVPETTGVNWTPRLSNASWSGVAASADGSKLVAVERGGRIYTSTDSGVTWTARESNREWSAVASSADGSKLVAAEYGTSNNGQIYTSTDYGVSWTVQTSAGSTAWWGVGISADGSRLAAAGDLRTVVSTDGGNTWTVRDQTRAFVSLAMSADGSVLIAGGNNLWSLYTSVSATTPGTAGWVSGAMYDTMELQYVGNGQFIVLSRVGRTPGFQ